MLPFNKEEKKQLELLLYKILNDALLLWIIVFGGLLVLEGLVPGYFSAYLSFIKMTLALFALLALIGYFGKRNDLSYFFPPGKEILKNKVLVALLVLSCALIINSLRDSGWFSITIISVGIFLALILLYKILILEE